MGLQSNPELELAYEYACYTDKSIFLTGRAGTGKTTFLHRIKQEGVKRMAVVAPTGVAAINAGGMTIHSFFQLPFGPYLPGNTRDPSRQRKFSGEKIRLIRSLDLLVIDEISMVRADLLDGIDEVLRRYKNPFQPFGGVQLLMIGDLHQLPPVVKEEEWYLLRDYYQTPYFFGSHALQQTKPVVVELKHVYRQSDDTFIRLLNRVRNNNLDADVLATLNSRFIPDFHPPKEEGYITLTTHNASAHEINSQKLEALQEKARRFTASISGDFPAHAYPTDEVLELKAGAQVMFVKNDPEAEKRFYNGKIGKIIRIGDDVVYVKCPDEPETIAVDRLEWSNVKYSLNEETKEISEEVIGTFTQFPLKLAWAITIHKSQGLTFERVILDAQAAFAHGQVYVALSRCKSFEGIVLCSKIDYSSIKTDTTVRQFSEEAKKNAPDQAQLEQSKIAFQQSRILELFGFRTLKKSLEKMNRILLEHEKALQTGALQTFGRLKESVESDLFPVAGKFRSQLQRLFAEGGLPEENETVQNRIRKAAAWFAEKLDRELQPVAKNIPILSDNKKVRKEAQETLENLKKELFIHHACFVAAQNGFSTQAYLQIKANADLDFQAVNRPSSEYPETPVPTSYPELFALLKKWRDDLAKTKGVEPYSILSYKSLIELVDQLPTSTAGLKTIHGIGKSRIKHYGAEIIAIVKEYCDTHTLTSPIEAELALKNQPKPDTKKVSFDLFQSGKSIEAIAAERGFVRSTIEGHLSHFIERGELSIFEVMSPDDVHRIEQYLADRPAMVLSEAKAHFGETYSYGELKMVMAHRNRSLPDDGQTPAVSESPEIADGERP